MDIRNLMLEYSKSSPALLQGGVTAQTNNDLLGVTFRDSKELPIHHWYPYVEGFSASYIQKRLNEISNFDGLVFDPFGGAGTVNLKASQNGIRSAFCELNPFMHFVAMTKINSTIWARNNEGSFRAYCKVFLDYLGSKKFIADAREISLVEYQSAFPNRDFFEDVHIRQLLAAKAFVRQTYSSDIQGLLLLAISSVVVLCSNMTRRADLRRRKPGEYKNRVVDVRKAIHDKTRSIIGDVMSSNPLAKRVVSWGGNARVNDESFFGMADVIITSPPYLNGTNYFRNTKLELWILDFIKSEKDLSSFNVDCVAGGISNVSKNKTIKYENEHANTASLSLKNTNGDKRISKLVRLYTSDMGELFDTCMNYLRPGSRMYLDIGDSKFYGVHVPTDKILMQAALDSGFNFLSENMLARRHSRDKTPLKQVELVLQKP